MRLSEITIYFLLIKACLSIRFDYFQTQPVTWDSFGASSGVVKSEEVKHVEENGGKKHNNNFYDINKGFVENGHESNHKHEIGRHGNKGRENLKHEDGEKGKYSKDYNNSENHDSKRHESKKGHKGAKFAEKEGHKRGHKTKGYHNQFFKDEYHKEHRFYDDYHRSGDYQKYGNKHSKFERNEDVYKKGGKQDSGKQENSSGKEGEYNQGHLVKEEQGFNNNEGKAKMYANFNEEGNKHEGSKQTIFRHHADQ